MPNLPSQGAPVNRLGGGSLPRPPERACLSSSLESRPSLAQSNSSGLNPLGPRWAQAAIGLPAHDVLVAYLLPRAKAFLLGVERRGNNMAARGLCRLAGEPAGDVALVALVHTVVLHVAMTLGTDAEFDALERA
jgi:hypothetical protein